MDVETIDLRTQIEHTGMVHADLRTEAVYDWFRLHPDNFVAVQEQGRLVGIVSRGELSFKLGSRYGFAVYGRTPVGEHLLQSPLIVRYDIDLLDLLARAFQREGEDFHTDCALVDEREQFLGFISVQRLVKLQHRLIAEKQRIQTSQQTEIEEQNRALFRSVAELRQSEGRFSILFENSAVGVALMDPHGRVELCNRCCMNLTGEPAFLNFAQMVIPTQRARFLDSLRRCEHSSHETQSGHSSQFALLVPGRGQRTFQFTFKWIAETGQICTVLDDITQRLALERQMAQREKSAMLDQMVGGIAHELNNKLSPIMGFSEMLMQLVRSGRVESETFLRSCGIICESAAESSKIISQLLKLSRPAVAERFSCDLGDIVDDCLVILRMRIRSAGARLIWQKPSHAFAVLADPGQLKQVIINLLINALDAMATAERRELRLELRETGENWSLSVSDSGHGIEPESIKRVFDPFFTTKAPDRGTGLGLSVCYSIVREHGGEIAVESEPGAGATFTISLPRTEEPLHRAGRSSINALPQIFREQPRRIRVLIVDDEPYVASLVHEVVRIQLGAEVERANDGARAIDLLRAHEFDLILSDVRMPGLDGFGVYEWVCENQPRLRERFLFITGETGGARCDARLESLGVPVLRKPFTLDALGSLIRNLLSQPCDEVLESTPTLQQAAV
ncbi:MAG: ATP-binding protein [Chthoniobacteraceae bacterium]